MSKTTARKGRGKAEATPTKDVKMVTIQDLEKETGVPGVKIRPVLRAAGMRAPAVKQEGFGPRAKYSWPEGSEELEKVRKLISEAFEVVEVDEDGEVVGEAPAKSAKAKRGSRKKKAEPEPEPVEDEDGDDDWEEDEEDED